MTCQHFEIITMGSGQGEEFGTCKYCGQVKRYYWQGGKNYDLFRCSEIIKEGVIMDKQKIIERYEQGDEIPDIIKEEGVTRKKLYSILHENGVELRTPSDSRRQPYGQNRQEESKPHPAIEALLGFLPPVGTPVSNSYKRLITEYFDSMVELMYPDEV